MEKKDFDDQDIISTVFLSIIMSIFGIIILVAAYMVNGMQIRYGWNIIAFPLLLFPCYLIISYENGVLLSKQKIGEVSIANILGQVISLTLLIIFAS